MFFFRNIFSEGNKESDSIFENIHSIMESSKKLVIWPPSVKVANGTMV
jgi:hypothetical protein